MKRREFLGTMTATATLTMIPTTSEAQEIPLTRPKETTRGDMRYRQLGSTKEEVSLLGMGGFHIGTLKEEKDSINQ